MVAKLCNPMYLIKNAFRIYLTILILLLLFDYPPQIIQASASVKRVNVPNLTNAPLYSPAIFWLGKVDSTSNYADVRICYYDTAIVIFVHIIDRSLWTDTTQSKPQISQWDSVSIYLNKDGNSGSAPGSHAYHFDTELSNLQASYQGNGTNWLINNSITITSNGTWRGDFGPNSNSESEGWVAYFSIPFSKLGETSAPSQGTTWGLGVVVHDRDDAAGSIQQDTAWPESMNTNIPSTWGQLSFGWPAYNPPSIAKANTLLVRQGLNGENVVDGAVGGYTTCGDGENDKWTDWGNRNYAGYTQFNIQNQWDISDWPCFSKYFITFPIGSIPINRSILSANITMSLFGTAGGGEWGTPPDSYIEVFVIDRDWNKATLTWNNAPMALENISGTWVPPVPGEYHWDVSKAVAQAYNSGQPLRLAFYSIDGDRHTGKYFYTSDSTDWNGDVRPTLNVTYGLTCGVSGVTCYKTYLPYTHQ
jgi:hypothetical protein